MTDRVQDGLTDPARSAASAPAPYRIYLRAELSKLRNAGDVAAFLKKGSCDLRRFGIPDHPEQITRLFSTQDRVDAFVQDLTDAQAVELTACCDRWRGNGIASALATAQRAQIVSVPVERILLREAESWMLPVLQRHKYCLPAVANDPEVLSRDPYRSRSSNETVDFPICIAKSQQDGSGMYGLVDGVHRAIQQFRSGESHLSLCVIST